MGYMSSLDYGMGGVKKDKRQIQKAKATIATLKPKVQRAVQFDKKIDARVAKLEKKASTYDFAKPEKYAKTIEKLNTAREKAAEAEAKKIKLQTKIADQKANIATLRANLPKAKTTAAITAAQAKFDADKLALEAAAKAASDAAAANALKIQQDYDTYRAAHPDAPPSGGEIVNTSGGGYYPTSGGGGGGSQFAPLDPNQSFNWDDAPRDEYGNVMTPSGQVIPGSSGGGDGTTYDENGQPVEGGMKMGSMLLIGLGLYLVLKNRKRGSARSLVR